MSLKSFPKLKISSVERVLHKMPLYLADFSTKDVKLSDSCVWIVLDTCKRKNRDYATSVQIYNQKICDKLTDLRKRYNISFVLERRFDINQNIVSNKYKQIQNCELMSMPFNDDIEIILHAIDTEQSQNLDYSYKLILPDELDYKLDFDGVDYWWSNVDFKNIHGNTKPHNILEIMEYIEPLQTLHKNSLIKNPIFWWNHDWIIVVLLCFKKSNFYFVEDILRIILQEMLLMV